MALNVYDSTKHHIGLRDRDVPATNYGFMLESSYTQELQREGIGAPDFGGATDLIGQIPSLSRWTQDDFIGGMFQWDHGRDDAMFADSLGFIPDAQGRALVSCPPMYLKQAFDPSSKTAYVSREPNSMFMVGGSIYLCFGHGLLRYEIDTGTQTWIAADSGGAPVTHTYAMAGYNPDDQKIWVLVNSTIAGDRPSIDRRNLDLTAPTYDSNFIGPSASENLTGYGMTLRDTNVVVALGRTVWVGNVPDDPDPDVSGAITWTKVGRLPGMWMDSQSYNGMTYILCSDNSFTSSVVAYDGDGILPICTFPTSFYAKCMIEYGGRIFVGGTGTDVNGADLYAELYEVTGASVRTVRTFSPETRTELANNGWPTSIEDLVVHEGLLWFCQAGKRLMAYDVTSDGFFGGSEILGVADLNFVKLVTGRGRVWGYGDRASSFTSVGIYRIAQPADSGTITPALWKPTMVTSDFAYEPGMKKRWREIKVRHRYGAMTSIEYSLNSGGSWTSLALVSEYVREVFTTTADLAGIAVSESIRFRFKLDSTDGLTYHKELVAFSVSFAMLDTGKNAWSFIIVGADEVETEDASLTEGVTQAQDVALTGSTLTGWAYNRTPLVFTDIDGATYDAQIVGFQRSVPVVSRPASGTYHEGFYSITLQEI